MRRISVVLLIIVGFLLSESTAFAQVVLRPFNEPIGPNDFGILISGQVVAVASLTTTTLRLTFPAPIVSDPGNPIHIEGAVGLFFPLAGATSPDFFLSIDAAAGVIRITLPGGINNALSGSFVLRGVRTYGEITLSLNNAANNYVLLTTRLQFGPGGTITIGAPRDPFENGFPFGGKFGTSLGTRYQQAYSSTQFSALGPILITSINFLDGIGNFAESNYTFYLSTISANINALSNVNFESNRGTNNTLFASVDLKGSVAATLRINGFTPFLYDPSQGNLLLDIVVSPGGVDGAGAYASRSGTAVGIFSRYHNFGFGTLGWGL